MSHYNISKWDHVIDCSGIKRPVLYFAPDPSILLQLQNNNNKLFLNIFKSDHYSGKSIPAAISISKLKSHSQESCNDFAAVLFDTVWTSSPKYLGSFFVSTDPLIPSCWKNTRIIHV